MDSHKENVCLCALNRIFGFEPRTGLVLMEHSGSAEKVFELSKEELSVLLGPYSKYKDKICAKAIDEAEAEIEALNRRKTLFIGCNDAAYPELLKECEDFPLGIYFRSSSTPEDVFCKRRKISVVGTRDISPYGREWCCRIIEAMAATDEKPCIISGLAIGTDICAHKAAIEAGLPTVAVMATGPDTVYPHRHMDFAERLVNTPGCALITDYPPDTAPLPIHFLRRNRIIAGISEATILIESKIKGGGMMTSRLAFSYSRDVFALPGRADDIRSQGCNYLIRDKVAEPVISPKDLIDSLGLKAGKSRKQQSMDEILKDTYGGSLHEDRIREMAHILLRIKKEKGISIETLAGDSGLEYSKVADMVGLLETEGIITVDLLQRCFINFFHRT